MDPLVRHGFFGGFDTAILVYNNLFVLLQEVYGVFSCASLHHAHISTLGADSSFYILCL